MCAFVACVRRRIAGTLCAASWLMALGLVADCGNDSIRGPGETASAMSTSPSVPAVPAAEITPVLRQAYIRAVQEGAAADYDFVRAPDDRILGHNQAQGVASNVGCDGLRMSPEEGGGSETGSWELGLRVAAVRRDGKRAVIRPDVAALEGRANRASLRHGGLAIGNVTEWYLNGPLGIEQGVVLDRAPAGSTDAALALEVEVAGDLEPVESVDGTWVSLQAADGTPVLRYADLFAHDAAGERLATWMKVEGETIALYVDDRTATYPVTVDPLVFVETKKLTASDAGDLDLFGWSVALSGDTAIVGARGELAAYVLERDLGGIDNWGERKKLTASDGGSLGVSVALEGDTAIVGAPFTGAAYVFERNLGGADNWGERKKITPSIWDFSFGASVALSGDTALVGSPSEDVGPAISLGAAYLFERNLGGADNWGERKRIAASDGQEGDHFGISVALSGDTALVGAQQVAGSGSARGAAYIFERSLGGADNWGERRKFTASDPENGDWFGYSVALLASTALVGAANDGGSDGDNCLVPGKAYVFDRDLGGLDNWGERKKLVASDADNCFGRSLALSGDTALVGAFGGAAGAPGSAHVFERNLGGADNWDESRELTASDGEDNDWFGYSVALSADTAIVGAPYEGDLGNIHGAAYVFDRRSVGGVWMLPRSPS